MKKKLLVSLVSGLLVFGVIEVAMAGPILQYDTNVLSQIRHYSPIGQSFTAEDVFVDYIGASIGDMNSSIADLTIEFKLYSGDGFFDNTHLIYTEERSLTSGFSGFVNFDVSSFTFDIGELYTFAFFNDTYRWGVRSSWNNLYQGGMMYAYGNACPNYELTFHVLPSTDPIPEPTTIFLLGAGLMGLAGTRIRRKKRG